VPDGQDSGLLPASLPLGQDVVEDTLEEEVDLAGAGRLVGGHGGEALGEHFDGDSMATESRRARRRASAGSAVRSDHS
jgi:hypothetical protein